MDGSMQFLIPESCRALFLAAGWCPGRRTDVSLDMLNGLESFSMGSALVREFGGLSVGDCGPGRDCARSDIKFFSSPSIQDRYNIIDVRQPADLFPIGCAHREHMELFIDSKGRIFGYGIPDGSLLCIGESFGDAVERLLLGFRLT